MNAHTLFGKDKFVIKAQQVLGLCLFFMFAGLSNQASAQHNHQQLGEVTFDTSCNAQAEETFKSGLALYHHMMYGQAEKVFSKATQQDSKCAIAYWGKALTYFHPLWPGLPSEADLKNGTAALPKPKKIRGTSAIEKAFISAATAFFKDWQKVDHKARVQTWETAQRALFDQYPNDIEAGALFGLSHLATAPKSDKSFTHQKEAGALLEELLAKAPQHPGLFHYIIHAYDNPVLAPRAVDVARGYDKLAPEVPHALHMPTHIFVRLGMWDDVIQWNIRSAEAAWNQPAGDKTSMHYVHALDYLMYAYLQQGEIAKANNVLSKIKAVDNFQAVSAAAYGIAAAQARLPLERRQWKIAASLDLRTNSSFPWDRFPEFEAMAYFARGYGAAKLGDLDRANEALQVLDGLYQKAVDAGQSYWSVHVDSERKTVAAWIAYANSDYKTAAETMRLAADIEDSVDKHPVTPGAVLPARELLGDLLLLLDKPAKALEAYEASLLISPNRFNSISGAARAAALLGDQEKAASYASQLVALTQSAGQEITQAN